jgi:hypothetical protein
MEQDLVYKMSFFGVFYSICFVGLYFYAKKGFPKLSIYLFPALWVIFMVCTYVYSIGIAIFVFPLSFIILFVLKPPKDTSFQIFYDENKIYKSEKKPQAVMDVLGDRRWSLAEGTLFTRTNERISYLFWQGSSSSTVYTGKTTSTSYSYYAAFIFEPNTVSDKFKEKALALMDTSHYTFKQKVKYFFTIDTDTPYLAKTTADGSFIIAYNTLLNVKVYAKYLTWLRTNMEVAPISNQRTPTYQQSWR